MTARNFGIMSSRPALGGASDRPAASLGSYTPSDSILFDGSPESFGPHSDRELAALLFGAVSFVLLFIVAIVLIAWGLFF